MNNPAVKWFTAGCFDDLNIMKDSTALLFRGCNGSYYNKSFSTFTALERVTVASSSLNGLERASFDSMANLVSIDVGDNSCSALSSLHIVKCGRLTSVKVGSHCFDGKPGRVIRELRIESCDALESVTIGDSSFSQWERITFSGSFSVSCLCLDLSSFTTLTVGENTFCGVDGSSVTLYSMLPFDCEV